MFWQAYVPGQVGWKAPAAGAHVCVIPACCVERQLHAGGCVARRISNSKSLSQLRRTLQPALTTIDGQQGRGRRRRQVWRLPRQLHLRPGQSKRCRCAAAGLWASRRLQQEGAAGSRAVCRQRVRRLAGWWAGARARKVAASSCSPGQILNRYCCNLHHSLCPCCIRTGLRGPAATSTSTSVCAALLAAAREPCA